MIKSDKSITLGTDADAALIYPNSYKAAVCPIEII